MQNFPLSLRASSDAVAGVGASAADYACQSATELLESLELIADLRRLADTAAAWAAAAIAEQCRYERGYEGVRVRAGFTTAEALIQSVLGTIRAEAVKLIEVGTVLSQVEAADVAPTGHAPGAGDAGAGYPGTGYPGTGSGSLDPDGAWDAPAGPPDGDFTGAVDEDGPNPAPSPVPVSTAPPVPVWQVPLARAISGGRLSVDAADAIRRGLGGIDPANAAELTAELTAACDQLIHDATTPPQGREADLAEREGRADTDPAPHRWGAGHTQFMNADQLLRRARRLRDQIDVAGIARREEEQHKLRSLHTWTRDDGMHCGFWVLPGLDGLFVAEAFTQLLSPRHGGPRFVDEEEKERARNPLRLPAPHRAGDCDRARPARYPPADRGRRFSPHDQPRADRRRASPPRLRCRSHSRAGPRR